MLAIDQARHTKNENDFFRIVGQTKISSEIKRRKLIAFQSQIKAANDNIDVSKEELYAFLNHFYILGYDLGKEVGVVLSLLHSHISQFHNDSPPGIWSRIVDIVQTWNQDAGTITAEKLPEDLREIFRPQYYEKIPEELSLNHLPLDKPYWAKYSHSSDLAIANLIGSWNEENPADLEVISQITNEDYGFWILKIREILHKPLSLATIKNGIWRIVDRKSLWHDFGARLFDDNLEKLKKCIVTVLTERDPIFDLPPEDQFSAIIYGKNVKCSPVLRIGLAETLALLTTQTHDLTNCSLHRPETIAVLAVREIFENSDWKLWGSLNNLLPILAEAAPSEFLTIAEKALQQSPCPFDDLFSQESNGITGRNYLTGLLSALEILAWDESFLVRVCLILGELASHDPGGNWANRPSNSLTTILLPWLPQTIASIDKRKVVLKTLQKEFPEVTWKLLISLLPNQHQVSMKSHRPAWRKTIPVGWKEGVNPQDYWDQVSYYAGLAVLMASNDIERLKELLGHLDDLPQPSFNKILEYLISNEITTMNEEDRLLIWTGLTDFTSKHRRFPNAKWALKSEIISKLEHVSKKLAPTNPVNLYRRYFREQVHDFYEENVNWQVQQEKLEEHRRQAILEILTFGGMDKILQFSEVVESPSRVGHSLGAVAQPDIDSIILPKLLETNNRKFSLLTKGFVWNRHNTYGWEWVDEVNKENWTIKQIGQFLSFLPFTSETWARASAWLGNKEGDYWAMTNVNPYEAIGDLAIAIDKLIEYKRPNAAIDCLFKMQQEKQFDKVRSKKALLAAIHLKEQKDQFDSFQVVEIIKALQSEISAYDDALFQIEWAYLPLLDRHLGAFPKLLETKLASDPNFFCEIIQILYRSKIKTKTQKEPSESEKLMAKNAMNLLFEWRTPPGMQTNGYISKDHLTEWLNKVKKNTIKTGHLEVALTHVGHVLVYSPCDSEGLWIDKVVADALNAKDAEYMRNGFQIELFNSRGVHIIDPTGKPERDLAENYRQKAEDVENAGYQRLAVTLRQIAEEYDREANRVIAEN